MRRFVGNAEGDSPRGFSLLEVILAIAILAASVAIVGEVMRFGLRNAAAARDKTKAILFCESKLAEIVSGVVAAEPTTGARIEELFDDTETAWVYSIEVAEIDDQGLSSVTITASQDLPDAQRPMSVSLTRWIAEISAETSTSSTTTDSSNTKTTKSPSSAAKEDGP